MDVRQCTETSTCEMVTCDQIRRLMPINLRATLRSCTARCCKNGVCQELRQNAGISRQPGNRFINTDRSSSSRLQLLPSDDRGNSSISTSTLRLSDNESNVEGW